MATITGFTASRMLAIENASVTSGAIDSAGRLQLKTKGGTTFDAGLVRDVAGITIYEQRLNAFETDKLNRVNGTATNLNSNTVRLSNTSVANLTATAHGFQIGPSNGSNLRADPNAIQSANNGTAATLYLNQYGGAVSIGNASGTSDVPGYLSLPKSPTANTHASNKKYVDDSDATRKAYIDNLLLAAKATPLTTNVSTLAGLNSLAEGYYRAWGDGIALGLPNNYGFLRITRNGSDGRAEFKVQNTGDYKYFAWNSTSTEVAWREYMSKDASGVMQVMSGRFETTKPLSISSVDHPIMIGSPATNNMNVDLTTIAARFNGVWAPTNIGLPAAANNGAMAPGPYALVTREYVNQPDMDTTLPTLSSIASGWEVTPMECVRTAGWMRIRFSIKNVTGAAMAAGNISNFDLFTIQNGFRPYGVEQSTCGDTMATIRVDPSSGIFVFTALAFNWSNNSSYSISYTYLLGR